MKNSLISSLLILLSLLVSVSCGNNTTENKADDGAKVQLGHLVMKGKVDAFDNMKQSPKKVYTFEIAHPGETDPDNQWLLNAIKDIIRIGHNTSLESGIDQIIENDGKEYQKEAKELTNGNNDFIEMLNYESNTFIKAIYNANDYLTLDYSVSSYEGGAHGNYATVFYNFDVKNKRKLELSEILHIDTAILQNLLEAELRTKYEIAASESLTTLLFEDFIKPNNNFYLTDTGIGFLYNTYEIAPYSAGQIDLLLPFNKVQPILTKEFSERFRLNIPASEL